MKVECARTLTCKMPGFFEKPPLSGVVMHPDFQVTQCLCFVTTPRLLQQSIKLSALLK
jgi:hypothetical protein